MGKDRISKDEAGDLLDQRVHMVTTTCEIRHITRNFVRLTGDYLGMEITLSIAMASWPCHIDRFERKYDKIFSGHRLFGEEIVVRIHKRVQVFLHSCNTMPLEDVETGALAESGEL